MAKTSGSVRGVSIRGGKDTVEEYTDQLSKIKNYAAEVISNRAEIQRLSKEDERGRIEGGIRNVEATILLAASGRESGQIKGREEQQRAIEDYAKAEGITKGLLGKPDSYTKALIKISKKYGL